MTIDAFNSDGLNKEPSKQSVGSNTLSRLRDHYPHLHFLDFVQQPSIPPTRERFPEDAAKEEAQEASALGDLDTVKRITHEGRGGMDYFGPALIPAIENGHLLVAAYLLEQGLEVEGHHLQRALQQRAFPFMQLFLDHGYSINSPNYPTKPGVLAERIDDEHLTRWLLDHGADPNAERICMECKMGQTPLSIAMWRAPWSIIQLLIERGGPESLRCGHLLWHVVQRVLPDRLEVMEYLLKNGAAADVRRLQFEDRPEAARQADWVIGRGTPLHTAACNGCLDAVKLLIAWGADPAQPDSKGRLPIDEAQTRHAVKKNKDNLQYYPPGDEEGVIKYLKSLAERTEIPAQAPKTRLGRL